MKAEYKAVFNKENIIGKTQVQTKQLFISINTQNDRNQLSTSKNKREQIYTYIFHSTPCIIKSPILTILLL